jgi:hypothetical protein
VTVRSFYEKLQCGELSNTRVGAFATSASSTSSVNTKSKDILPEHYRQNTTAGQAWFDLCCQLPLCDYLSRTDAGAQYELTPTRANICKVLSLFLTGQPHTFHNFQSLCVYWNQHRRSQNSSLKVGDDEWTGTVTGIDDVVTFRAPFSDSETIRRETGRLNYGHSNCALLVEIEKAHGLASVRHLRADNSKLVWRQTAVKTRLLHHWQSIFTLAASSTSDVSRDGDRDSCYKLNLPQLIVLSAALGDDLLYSIRDLLVKQHKQRQQLQQSPQFSDTEFQNVLSLTAMTVLSEPSLPALLPRALAAPRASTSHQSAQRHA